MNWPTNFTLTAALYQSISSDATWRFASNLPQRTHRRDGPALQIWSLASQRRQEDRSRRRNGPAAPQNAGRRQERFAWQDATKLSLEPLPLW